MTFAQPGAPDGGFSLKEHGPALTGALVLFAVHELRQGFVTSQGTSDAIVCDIAPLSGPLAGQVFEDAMVFPPGLVSALRGRLGANIGEQVLGRVVRGVPRNPAHTPPWRLEDYTAADADEARRFLAAFPDFGKVAPTQPSQAAQPRPYSATPTAALQPQAYGYTPEQTAPATAPAPQPAPAAQPQPAAAAWSQPTMAAATYAPDWSTVPELIAAGVNPAAVADYVNAGVTPAVIRAVAHVQGWQAFPPAALPPMAAQMNATPPF